MGNDDDLGIRSDVKFLERLEYGIGFVLGILDLEIFNYVYVVLLIIIIGNGLFS